MYRVWDVVTNSSALVVAGAILALVWAQVDPAGYRAFAAAPLPGTESGPTIRFLVNGVLMALVFAFAFKEVWEALVLQHGAFRGRRGAAPLLAATGGVTAPVLVYVALAAALAPAQWDALAAGWAVPAATDIAISYVVGRAIFGAGHPALRLILLLALADDAAGLAILALAYPAAPVDGGWLLLPLGAGLGAYLLFNRLPRGRDGDDPLQPRATRIRMRFGLWPYAVAGAFSWYGVYKAGLNPALGLLPIVPAIPHSDHAFGVFAEAEGRLADLLNRAAHLVKLPVEISLFLFALVNAGAPLGAFGTASWLVLAALLLGKPLGILAGGWLAARPLGLGWPAGIGPRTLIVVGLAAAAGFTMPLFIAASAFGPGPTLEAARLGVLLSLCAAVPAFLLGRGLGVHGRR